MAKKKLFKDDPAGEQLHAGRIRGKFAFHSDDGGKTWWSGLMFSHEAKVTSKELEQMALSVLRELPNLTKEA